MKKEIASEDMEEDIFCFDLLLNFFPFGEIEKLWLLLINSKFLPNAKISINEKRKNILKDKKQFYKDKEINFLLEYINRNLSII